MGYRRAPLVVSGIDDVVDRSIVDAVISLAHGLGIGVVPEGIETQCQADLLVELGCDLGQGYLFSRPVPGEETAGLLAAATAGAALGALAPSIYLRPIDLSA